MSIPAHDVEDGDATGLAGLRELLLDRISTQAIFRASDGHHLVDPNGQVLDWLLDLRPLLTQSSTLSAISQTFWERFRSYWPFQLAAQEMAAVPLLGALLLEGERRGLASTGLVIRRERKQYGRQLMIEGQVSGADVILVDDIINSGTAAQRGIAAIADAGARTAHHFTILSFGNPAASERLAAAGVQGVSVLCLDEVAPLLPKTRKIEDASPLEVVWHLMPERASFSYVARKASPAVAGGVIVHASEDGWIQALDCETGATTWRFQGATRVGKGIWSTPLIRDGHVFFGSYDGVVFCLRLVDGTCVWRFDGADWVGSSACSADRGRTIVIGLEHALLGGRGAIIKLRADDGTPCWEHRTAGTVHATPVVLADDRVICGGNDRAVRCLDGQSGRLIWKRNIQDHVKSAALIGGNDLIYVASRSGHVLAIKTMSGEVAWQTRCGGAVFASPVEIDADIAVASADGWLYRLDRETGGLINRIFIGGKLFAAPVRIGSSLFIGSTSGKLATLGVDDFSVQAVHQFPERITCEIAFDQKRLYVPTFDGQLFAIPRSA